MSVQLTGGERQSMGELHIAWNFNGRRSVGILLGTDHVKFCRHGLIKMMMADVAFND